MLYICFFFNDSATPEIYTLSLHDALPIYIRPFETYVEIVRAKGFVLPGHPDGLVTVRLEIVHEGLSVTQVRDGAGKHMMRSEEHTSELQSRLHLVCRLLLEKKNTKHTTHI